MSKKAIVLQTTLELITKHVNVSTLTNTNTNILW